MLILLMKRQLVSQTVWIGDVAHVTLAAEAETQLKCYKLKWLYCSNQLLGNVCFIPGQVSLDKEVLNLNGIYLVK